MGGEYPYDGGEGKLHINITKSTEIGVESGDMEVTEFYSDIQHAGKVLVQPLGDRWEGATFRLQY